MPRRRKRPRNGPRNEYVGLSGTLPDVSLNNKLSLEVEAGLSIEHHCLDEDGRSVHFQLDRTLKATSRRRNVGKSGDVLFGGLSSEAAIMEYPLGPELPQGTSKVLQLFKDNRQQGRQPLTPHQPDGGLSEGTCSSDDHFLGAGDDFIPLNTPQQSGSLRGVECGEHTGERRPVTKWFRSPAKSPRAQQKPSQATTSKSPPAKSGFNTTKGNKQHCIDTFDARDVIVRLHTSEAGGGSRGVECGEHTGEHQPNPKWFRSFVKRLQALQKPDQATTSKSPSTKSGLKATKGNVPSSGTTVGGLTSKTNPQKIILPQNTTTKAVAKKTKGKSKKQKTRQEATTPPQYPPKRVVRTVDYTKDIDVSNPFAVSFRSPVKRDNAMDSVFQGKKRRISRSFGGIYSEREPPNMFLVNKDPNWQVVKEDLPYYRSRLKRPVICDVCYSDKHSRRKCRKFRFPCVICGAYDHLERFCKKKAMYFGEYWTLKQFRYRNYTCQTCGTGGHLARSCTNHWRQFHNTTASSVSLQRLDRNDQRNDEKVFCFNCGLEGHLGFECRTLLNRLRTSIMAHQPFVYKYTAKFNPKSAYMKPLPGFEKNQPSSPDTSYYEEMEEYSHEVDQHQVDRREVDLCEVDRHQVDRHQVDHREVDRHQVDRHQVDHREVDRREVDHCEVDRREVDHCEVDRREVDRLEVDRREVDHREEDLCEVDRHQVDCSEVDRHQVDRHEVDCHEVDRREVDRSEVDRSEVDCREVARREVDRREVDHREVDHHQVDCQVVEHREVNHREVLHLLNEFPTRVESQNTLSKMNVERDLKMTEGGSSRDVSSSLRRDEEHVLERLNGLIDENGLSRKRGRDDGSSDLECNYGRLLSTGDDSSRLQTREGCNERLSSNDSHVVRLPALEHQSNGLSEQEGRTDLVNNVVGMTSKASEGKGAKRKRKRKGQRLNSKASVESTSCSKGGGNSDEVTSLPPVKKKKKIKFSRNIPQGAFVVLPERLIEFRPYLFPLDANYTFLETKRLNRFFKKRILHLLEKKDRHSRKEPYGSWGPHVIVVSKYRENLAFAISSLKGKPEVEDLSSLHQRFEDLFKLSLLWVLEFEIEGRRKAEVNALRTLFSDEEGWDEGYITALTVLPALDFKHYSQVATRKAHISHEADTLTEDVTPSTSNTEAVPVNPNQNDASGTTESPIPSRNNQNQSSSLNTAVFQMRPSVQSEQVVLSPTSTQEEGIPSQSEPTSLTEDPSRSPTRATPPSKRSKRLSYLSPELEKYLSENFTVLDSWEFGSDDVRDEEVSLHDSNRSRTASTTLDSTSGSLCNTASEISTSSTLAVGVLHNDAMTVSSLKSTSKAPSLHNVEATLHNSTTMPTPDVTLGGSQSPKVGFGSELEPDSSFNSKSPDFIMGSSAKSNTSSNSSSYTHHSALSLEEEHHHIVAVNEDSVSFTSPASQNGTEPGRLGKKRQLDLSPGKDLHGSTEKFAANEETIFNERVMQSPHHVLIEASRSVQIDSSIETGEGSWSTSEVGVHAGSEVPFSPNSLQLAINKTLLGVLPDPIMSELAAQQTSILTGANGNMGEIPDSSKVMPLMAKHHTEVDLCEVVGPTEPAISTSNTSIGVKSSQIATTDPVATTGTLGPVATTGTTDPLGTTGTTGPVATTGTTGPVVTAGTTGPVATTGTTGPVATTGTTDPGATACNTDSVGTTGTTRPPPTLKPIFLEEADVPLVQSIDCYCLTREAIQMLQVRRSELKIPPKSKSRWKTKVSPTSKLPATISLTDMEKERMCEYLEELRKELDILKRGRSEMKWNQELKKQKSWRGAKPALYSNVVDVTDRSVPCMDRWRTIQDLLTLFMCQYVRKVERLSLPEVTNRMRKAWRDGADWN